jgi:hypothetical protein
MLHQVSVKKSSRILKLSLKELGMGKDVQIVNDNATAWIEEMLGASPPLVADPFVTPRCALTYLPKAKSLIKLRRLLIGSIILKRDSNAMRKLTKSFQDQP